MIQGTLTPRAGEAAPKGAAFLLLRGASPGGICPANRAAAITVIARGTQLDTQRTVGDRSLLIPVGSTIRPQKHLRPATVRMADRRKLDAAVEVINRRNQAAAQQPVF